MAGGFLRPVKGDTILDLRRRAVDGELRHGTAILYLCRAIDALAYDCTPDARTTPDRVVVALRMAAEWGRDQYHEGDPATGCRTEYVLTERQE